MSRPESRPRDQWMTATRLHPQRPRLTRRAPCLSRWRRNRRGPWSASQERARRASRGTRESGRYPARTLAPHRPPTPACARARRDPPRYPASVPRRGARRRCRPWRRLSRRPAPPRSSSPTQSCPPIRLPPGPAPASPARPCAGLGRGDLVELGVRKTDDKATSAHGHGCRLRAARTDGRLGAARRFHAHRMSKTVGDQCRLERHDRRTVRQRLRDARRHVEH